jgi:NADH-quinone oxidoreductase subunit N
MTLLSLIAPELVLIAVACGLFFLGTVHKPAARRAAAGVALVTLVGVFAWQLGVFLSDPMAAGRTDDWGTVRVGAFVTFVNVLVTGVGSLLVLLAWPTNEDATGSPSYDAGGDVAEFFALGLLSLAGVMLVAGANDLILLFLGIELAAIPTYIMVSISRPLPVAQEAGVKYFFLGAMAAAVMLFGFSYLYGTTGHIKLDAIAGMLDATRAPGTGGWGPPTTDGWLLLGVVVLLAGFAFKIAAVPLHAYAGDVYQGAATPVTALIAFVPKTSGFIAIIKLLSAVGGEHWAVPDLVVKVLWAMALLTMTVGNVLGLLQLNIKRTFAYSSIAHSGYILVGITALVTAVQTMPHHTAADQAAVAAVQTMALQGVLFYLLSYGIMNTGAFGVLMMMPSRAHQAPDPSRPAGSTRGGRGGVHTLADSVDDAPPVTTAETFEDLAGLGRTHPWLGLAMTVCCLSLTGLPLTIGFFGKFYLVQPALQAQMWWLAAFTLLNAAISAAYYLKVVATLFIRLSPAEVAAGEGQPHAPARAELLPPRGLALSAGVLLAIVGTLGLGVVLPATDAVTARLGQAVPTITLVPIRPPTAAPVAAGPADPSPAAPQAAAPQAAVR